MPSRWDRWTLTLGQRRGEVQEWGETFNLEFLDMIIEEQQRRLLGNPFRIPAWLYWLRKKVFGLRWVAELIFWSQNLVSARQLSEEFGAYMQSTRGRSSPRPSHVQGLQA